VTEPTTPSPPPPGWESLLARLVDLTGEDLEPRQLMHRVAVLIRDVTGTDACFVHLVDDQRSRLVLAGATPPFDHLAGTIELAVGEGVAGWVAEHGRPAIVEDKWHDARYKYIPALRGEDFTSMVSLPLVRPGPRVVGVFNLHTQTRRHFTTQEVAALSSVAGLLAGIVENRLLYHRLAEREAELERFAARTVELQELERRRLGSTSTPPRPARSPLTSRPPSTASPRKRCRTSPSTPRPRASGWRSARRRARSGSWWPTTAGASTSSGNAPPAAGTPTALSESPSGPPWSAPMWSCHPPRVPGRP
jgi:putative methionine-R-sulfoxide reductase with GAF domain